MNKWYLSFVLAAAAAQRTNRYIVEAVSIEKKLSSGSFICFISYLYVFMMSKRRKWS